MSSYSNNNNNCKQLYRKVQQPSQQYQGQQQMSRTQELERQLKNCQLSKIEQAEIYNSLGNEYYSQTQYWKAINAHTRALKLTVHSGKECRVIAFRCLGESYRQLKKYKKGLLYCQQHLEMAQQQHHELEIQRALCNMGLLYTDSAEHILLENKNVSEQFEITINLAIDNLLKSQNQVNKVIGIKKQLSFGQLPAGAAASNYNYLQDTSLLRLQQIEADAIYNQANALSIKAKWDNAYYEESITRLKEAASLSNSIKYAILEGKCYNTLGLIYLHQKNYDKSLKCYLKDVEICQREKDVHGVIETYISIGVLFQGKRDYSKSQEYFEKAMSIAKRNRMSESVQKIQESLSNLSAEIALREESNVLEVKIKKSNGKFNESMCVQYWDALIQLEDFTGLLDFINGMSCTSNSSSNSIHLKMMQYKAIAEASLKRFQVSRESYEKVLNEQRKQQIISVDFANNLIEYSNVLDELHEQTENIERGYLEALEVAQKLQDFYVMKVVLENLDILYESKKCHNKRKEIKKKLNKLLAEHPELKQSSASKEKEVDSDDDDDEGDSSDEDSSEENDGDQFHQQTWENQQSLLETPLQKNARIESVYQDEESGNYDRGEIQQRRVSNKNFLRPAANKNNNIQPKQESRNHNSSINNNLPNEPKTDLFSLVNNGGSKNADSRLNIPNNNNPQHFSSLKQPNAKRPIEEAYTAKCKKAIIEPDDQITSMLKHLKTQETSAFHIKNRYFEDDSIAPALKSLKYLQAPVQSLLEFNISHNLLSNQSIGLIISSVVIPQPSLERVDISYNSFVYDHVFAGFLQHCQGLKKLRHLNISGLLLAEVNQDDCWHQLLLLSSMQTLKFKHSSLNSLPEFLPLSISSSALDNIVLRYNQIHSSNPNNTKVIADILAFRNLQKFDISNQLEIL